MTLPDREPRGMRRPPHFDLGSTPYFVSTRTHQSARVFVGSVAAIAVEQLLRERDRYGFLLLAFVFMPDHAHFVIVPSGGRSISQTMRIVKGGIARRVNRVAGTKGPVWQDGFHDRSPRTVDELNACIEYVHQNPVEADLVRRPEDYSHSSATGSGTADYQRFFEEMRL